MATDLTLVAGDISADMDRGAWIDSTKQAGAALTVGDLVILDSNNKLQKAQANSAANARVYGMVVGTVNSPYGETAIAANDYPAVCIAGNVFVGPGALFGSTALAAGQYLYLSNTAAKIADGTAAGHAWNLVIGRAEGADSIYLMPGQGTPASS